MTQRYLIPTWYYLKVYVTMWMYLTLTGQVYEGISPDIPTHNEHIPTCRYQIPYNYALLILQSSVIEPLPSSHGKLARAIALAGDSPLQQVGFTHLYLSIVFAVTSNLAMRTCRSPQPKPSASCDTLLLRYLLRLRQQTKNCVLRFVLYISLASCSRVAQAYPIQRLLVKFQPMLLFFTG